MWPSRRCDSAVDIPHSLERPWTPPDVEDRPYVRSDRFNLYGHSPSRYPRMTEQHWLNEADRLREQPSWVTKTYSPKTPSIASRPKLTSHLTEPLPYTPTRAYHYDASYSPSRGMPRYPYTPESSQILRRHTEIPTSPTPWDNYSDQSLSPVQDALSSCIAHFEDLIQSRQPNEDQMEYILRQFEAMATHLSDPEVYTKETGARTYSLSNGGAGIMQAEDANDDLADAKSLYHQAYVAEVSNYVESVQKCINELKKRLDEVKTLNSIQLDVINDLRREMKSVRQNMRDELERGHGSEKEKGGEFKITKVVDLDKPRDHQPSEAQYAEDGDDINDNTKNHDNEDDARSIREFGLDSWQTLVVEEEEEEDDDNELSQEIHNEYTKLVRSAVHNLTADDNLFAARPAKRRLITIIRSPPPKRSFWASIGEALDAMSNLLLED